MNSEPFAVLYDDFIATKNDPDKIVEFYHKNALFFNNIKSITNTHDLDAYIMVINQYAMALYQKKRFTKCVEFVDDRLPFVDQEIARLQAHEAKTQWYHYILFYKAASLYDTGNYKAAHPFFIELIENDPENESFKMWLKHTDYNINKWILHILSTLSAILVFGGLIFGKYIHNLRLRELIPSIGFIIGLGTLACDQYLKRKFKKEKE